MELTADEIIFVSKTNPKQVLNIDGMMGEITSDKAAMKGFN